MIKKGLCVRQPHIDKLLDGSKTWEMRSTITKYRGRIYLLSGGLILGEIDLIGCLRPLKLKERRAYKHKHQCDDLSVLEKWSIPWVMESPMRYAQPKPYKHPKGCVNWVNFN